MAAVTVEKDETIKPRRSRFRWLGFTLAFFLMIVGVGALLKSAGETHGFTVVSDSVAGFADLMRIIRPLLIFICFCYWHSVVRVLQKFRILNDRQAENLVRHRNRFFLWVALLEISIGQGFVVVGLAVLVSILVVTWVGARSNNDS